MKQRDLIEQCSAPASIVRAVVRQLGGWAAFEEAAPDIARHGIGGGFSGFIYYADTEAFTRRNLPALRGMVRDLAGEFGQSVGEFLGGFGCLKDWGYSAEELSEAFYTGKGEASGVVFNALAWFAAEEVARAYDDAT